MDLLSAAPALRLTTFLALASLSPLAGAPSSPSPTWDFIYPDHPEGTPPALDLSYLNEEIAGQHGFIRLSPDGNSFVRGDGQPIRFWPVNEMALEFDDASLRRHARFLARIGVNMTRYHVSINPKGKGTSLYDFDLEKIRTVWRYVAAMKQEGIYSTISPFWPHDWFMGSWVPEEWGIDGYSGNTAMWGVFYFNDPLREGYKNWVRALYTLTNPYTGIPLREDPAVAIIQIMNEDGVFWWSMDEYMTPGLQRSIVAKYIPWLTRRYGSLEAAFSAWGPHRLPEDDVSASSIGLFKIRDLLYPPDGAPASRMRDQTEFYAETQRTVYAEMGAFYRDELGCPQIINAMDWTAADASRLLDLERWTNTANEVLATNRYFDARHDGPKHGWLIQPGDTYVGPSALLHPERLPINVKQVDDHPFLIVESGWNNPQIHAAEGPFLIAAYQSLTGMDGFFWFCVTDETYAKSPYVDHPDHILPDGTRPMLKWTCSIPGMMAQFPANALLFRQGYLQQGAPVVQERRTFADLINRAITPMSEMRSYDPNRTEGITAESAPATPILNGNFTPIAPTPALRAASDSLISPLAFLVGPVTVDLSADTSSVLVSDQLEKLIDNPARSVRSNTGEHLLDFGQGICRVDSPKAKGVCGFLSRVGKFELEGLTIESSNEFAAIWVVSLDGEPIATSSRLLVQCGTRYLPTGWREEPAEFTYSLDKVVSPGFRILDVGRMPWQADATAVKLSVNNPTLAHATLLDTAGHILRKIEVQRLDGRLSVTLPAESLYLILER